MGRRAGKGRRSARQRQRSERKQRKDHARAGGRAWREPGPRRALCSGGLSLPPRLDQPVELRIVWYRNAIRILGGEPWSETGQPEHDLSRLAMQYADLGGRGRALRDYFSPPLEIPDPSSLPDGDREVELAACLERLEGLGIDVLCCDHLSAAEVLVELRRILDEESEPPPHGGAIVVDASWSCQRCQRMWLRDRACSDGTAA